MSVLKYAGATLVTAFGAAVAGGAAYLGLNNPELLAPAAIGFVLGGPIMTQGLGMLWRTFRGASTAGGAAKTEVSKPVTEASGAVQAETQGTELYRFVTNYPPLP